MARSAGPWKLRQKGPLYYVRFSHAGRRYELATGEGQAGAAGKRAAEIYAKTVGSPPKLRRPAAGQELEPLVAGWLCTVEETRSADWEATCRIYWRAHWSTRWSTLEEITSAAIQRYIGERLSAGATPTTTRKELSALRGLLRWCQRQGALDELPTWQSPSGRSDYEAEVLTRSEVEAVLGQLPSRAEHPKRYPVREYYTVMWATSLRRGSLARIRWDDVDLDGASLLVRSSADKRQNQRRLPLTPAAIEALRQLGPGVGLIFGRRDFRAALDKALKAAGLGDRKITANHSFRHARLTDLASRTSNIAAIQHMAGHRDLASTMRYVHGAEQLARTMLEEIGDAPSPVSGESDSGEMAGEETKKATPEGGLSR